jgi:phosphohistidine phosphatase
MRTLFLLRHAKSSWDNGSVPDFERPLNSRGRAAAETMAAVLRERNINPDLILSSPALRAKETIEIIIKSAQLQSVPQFDQRIYEATAGRLLEVVSEIDNETQTALLVGHNPGFEQLVTALTGQTESMPTAALAKITFDISNWTGINAGGTLESVIRQKELPQT